MGNIMNCLRNWSEQPLRLLASLAASLVLAACGGGGDGGGFAGTGGVGSGGTGMLASDVSVSGPIRGFGSVIVNGIRFDDSSASISLGDDNGGARSADLRLGMMVEIAGERGADGLTGVARTITARSYVEGPISAMDVQAGLLTVLGVTVAVNADTVYDGDRVAGLADLAQGDRVEVHGIPDASGQVQATRIERKPASNALRMTGRIERSDAASITVNGITVRTPPGGLTPGMLVRIEGTLANDGAVVAHRARDASLASQLQATGTGEVEVEGVVTAFTSPTAFEVNGVKVAVADTAKREGGAVAQGVRIEVEGSFSSDGTLQARKVEVKPEDDEDNDDDFELHGRILAVDPATQTFTVNGRTIRVQWKPSTRFDDRGFPRGAASLAAGMEVEVKGNIRGNVLEASHIELND